jgi:hypothetical protein
MINDIPTAEEFFKSKKCRVFSNGEIKDISIDDINEYTKLHVEAALKEALDSIPCLGSSSDIATYEEVENAVLNAYPLTNIK